MVQSYFVKVAPVDFVRGVAPIAFIHDPRDLILLVPAILYAITIHEFAHAWVAYRLGDPTAKSEGRVTLNPVAHLDPIGTIALLLVGFGWGKPVPVNPYNLRHPLRDHVLISAAGPASNVVSAVVFGLLARAAGSAVMSGHGGAFAQNAFGLLFVITVINLVLAIFNLLPLAPLDGSHVLRGLLPRSLLPAYQRFNRYSWAILLGLILLPRLTDHRVDILGVLLFRPVTFLATALAGLRG